MQVGEYCKENNVSFASTPYSISEVDFLVDKCNVPFIKIASMDLVNYPFLEYISHKRLPIILSTGMGSLEEIRQAIDVIEKAGNSNICLLHCISIYPPEISTIRLKNIVGLREEFKNYPIGFSDHSLGIEMASAAVALGAALIEKHFTLDKSKIGMDNQMALEPNEMAQLVQNCHNVHLALGNETRIVFPAELEKRTIMRRSVVYTSDLLAGSVLTKEDLTAKRPGTGYPPEKIGEFVGRIIKRNVTSDTIVLNEDFL